MTTFSSVPTFTSSTSVPPGTPPPSPPPGGPTGPTPTGPARLVDAVESHLSAPLAILVAEVLDGDHAPEVRDVLNEAATNVSAALCALARIESPLVVPEEGPAPGSVVHGGAAGERPGAGFHLREGAHRPIGRVDLP